jgi:hypothetical protein
MNAARRTPQAFNCDACLAGETGGGRCGVGGVKAADDSTQDMDELKLGKI